MTSPKLISLLLGALTALSAASCNKDEVAEPTWFGTHTRYYYDLRTDTSFEEGALLLSVTPQRNGEEWFFYEKRTDTSTRMWGAVFGIFGNGFLKLRPDGIYSHASNTCNVGLNLSGSFDFLMIPAHPERGAAIQQYGCERQDDGRNEILSSDTLISVPAGEFRTFCVRHPNGDKSWWNRDIGIVMYWQRNYGTGYPNPRSLTATLRRME